MNCKNVLPLLSAYVDRELSGSESLAVREHLRQCPTCQCEADTLHGVKSQLTRLSSVTPPAGIEARLQRSVFDRKSDRVQKLAIGALVAATSMAAALFAIHLSEKPSPSQLTAKKDPSSHALDAAADRAYLSGNDPISGSVPVVTVSYAGDH